MIGTRIVAGTHKAHLALLSLPPVDVEAVD